MNLTSRRKTRKHTINRTLGRRSRASAIVASLGLVFLGLCLLLALTMPAVAAQEPPPDAPTPPPENTPVSTSTPTPLPAATDTVENLETQTAEPDQTDTPTVPPPSPTTDAADSAPTPTAAPSEQPGPTPTTTPSPTPTATATPVETAMWTPSPTLIATVIGAPTLTITVSASPTTLPSPTGTVIVTPSPTPIVTLTPTVTGTVVAEPTITATLVSTVTITPVTTITPTTTVTPTATATPVDLSGDRVADEIVVGMVSFLGDAPETMRGLAGSHDASIKTSLKGLGAAVWKVPPEQASHIIAALQRNPFVEFAEPNYLVRPYFEPDDPLWVEQSYLANIQLPQAWDVITGTTEVVIGVVDTGIDLNHPDLVANIWHNPGEMGSDGAGIDRRSNGLDDDGNGYVDDWTGWNTVAGNQDVLDDHGHGTLVAGVAAASTNNGQGVAGVASQAHILPVKALNSNGFGSYAQVAEGIIYAADHGARVINMSFGSPAASDLLRSAVDYAYDHGAVVIAAAGNSGQSELNYPAAYLNVIAVGATDANDQLAPFSTFGPASDLVAPGVDIQSTYLAGSYTRASGTSMSAAQVSGVAGLLASLPQFDTPAKIRAALESTAADLSTPGWDLHTGYGLVQAYDASIIDVTSILTPTVVFTGTPVNPVEGGVSILATPTAPPPAATAVPIPGNPHVYHSATSDSCSACHRPHTATGQSLRQAWPEESLCFGCHSSGSGSPANAVRPAFTSYLNTATRFFKHDVTATNGVHGLGQMTGTDYSDANRHVECEDCHEPHTATRGPADPPMLQRALTDVSGVDPVWTASGAPDSFKWLGRAEREYQVCFKCHSGFTTLPTYVPDGWQANRGGETGQYVANGLLKLTSTDPKQVPDSRDLAQEFNPGNASFHPVAAEGRNQSIPPASFVDGWSQTSMVYCSDCHDNANAASQGNGPHGSPLLHMLVGAPDNGGQVNYPTTGVGIEDNTSDRALCFKCHNASTYLTKDNDDTNFRQGNENLHGLHMEWGATCYACHDTHGSEQLHLINFEITSQLQPNGDRTSQTAWFAVGSQFGCALTCHGENHNGDVDAEYRYP